MRFGIVELIFSIIIFCIIWVLIFKFKLILDEKRKLKNIDKKIEGQDIKTDLIDELKKVNPKLPKAPTPEPTTPKSTKKEDGENKPNNN